MPPTTIAEYKSALLRLNVSLPTRKLSLAEYKALYAEAMAPLAAIQGATCTEPEARRLSRDGLDRYETPLTRTPSEAESMTRTAELSAAIPVNAAYVRNTVSASLEASPHASPKSDAATPPARPTTPGPSSVAEAPFSLPAAVVDGVAAVSLD